MANDNPGPATDRESLARRVYKPALGYATRQARGKGPPEMVEACQDAATDAVVHACKRMAELSDPEAYAWLSVRRAVRRAISDWQTRGRIKTTSLTMSDGSTLDYEAREYSAEVRSAEVLELLPKQLADVVRLVHVEGRSTAEAGRVLGVDRGTVNRRLAVARARLTGERAVIQPRSGGKRTKQPAALARTC